MLHGKWKNLTFLPLSDLPSKSNALTTCQLVQLPIKLWCTFSTFQMNPSLPFGAILWFSRALWTSLPAVTCILSSGSKAAIELLWYLEMVKWSTSRMHLKAGEWYFLTHGISFIGTKCGRKSDVQLLINFVSLTDNLSLLLN